MSENRRPARALVGTVLEGSYRLTRLIGEGGMGSVFEAVQMRLNKRIAIKVMAGELVHNPEALARFRREVHVTSQLAHPHIVHVSDFGTAPGGELFLVMEYLEGEDLEQRLRRVARLPLATVAHIVKQTASALSVTHARGVVHRDLKPANLFLLEVEGERDFVKVLDFGISKVKAATTNLTRPSVVMGTPKYMSPEHAMGKVASIDHRSDQWALACIAWEMLGGREPFVGGDVAALLYDVVHGEPTPLRGRVEGLPDEVEEVLRRALSKRSGDRFATIAAFARAFAAAAGTRATPLPLLTPAPAFTPPPAPPSDFTARRSGGASPSNAPGRIARLLGRTPAPRPGAFDRLRDMTGAFVAGLPTRVKGLRRRRTPSGFLGYTMAIGKKAWEGWVPGRRKRPKRKLAWISAAGVGATLLLGALLLLRSGWRPLP